MACNYSLVRRGPGLLKVRGRDYSLVGTRIERQGNTSIFSSREVLVSGNVESFVTMKERE